jgi:hypothetical protein
MEHVKAVAVIEAGVSLMARGVIGIICNMYYILTQFLKPLSGTAGLFITYGHKSCPEVR